MSTGLYTIAMDIDFRQTVFVSVLFKDEIDNILLLRRSKTEDFMAGYYELPGGRVNPGESIELAIRRKLLTDIGIATEGRMEFMGSSAYVDSEGPYLRLFFIVKKWSEKIQLGKAYDGNQWVAVQETGGLNLTKDTRLFIEEKLQKPKNNVDINTTYIVNSDGGSRGNPGPSAAAYVIRDITGKVVESGGEYIGINTNNQAEYTAVLLALRAMKGFAGLSDAVECRIDSLLVVSQLNQEYKIKNRDLWPLNQAIVEEVKLFGRVLFKHVPREENIQADAKVNEILDNHEANT